MIRLVFNHLVLFLPAVRAKELGILFLICSTARRVTPKETQISPNSLLTQPLLDAWLPPRLSV